MVQSLVWYWVLVIWIVRKFDWNEFTIAADCWASIVFCSIWSRNGLTIYKTASFRPYYRASDRWIQLLYSVSAIHHTFARARSHFSRIWVIWHVQIIIFLLLALLAYSQRCYRFIPLAIWAISTRWSNCTWYSAWCSKFHIAYGISCARIDNPPHLPVTSNCLLQFVNQPFWFEPQNWL